MSTNTIKDELLANLEDKEYRELFVEQHINRTVAFQIRATRETQNMKQADLGKKVGMAQARISLLEDPNYGNFTINTLKRIANELDVALIVRFVPFTQLVAWVGGESQIIPGLSPQAVAVPKFEDDLRLLKEKEKQRQAAKRNDIPKAIKTMIAMSGQSKKAGLMQKQKFTSIEQEMTQATKGH